MGQQFRLENSTTPNHSKDLCRGLLSTSGGFLLLLQAPLQTCSRIGSSWPVIQICFICFDIIRGSAVVHPLVLFRAVPGQRAISDVSIHSNPPCILERGLNKSAKPRRLAEVEAELQRERGRYLASAVQTSCCQMPRIRKQFGGSMPLVFR